MAALLLLLSFFAVPATADLLSQICGTTGEFDNNSIYSSNLNILLSSVSSNASATGFTTSTIGSVPNRIYGLTLCRGDLDPPTCRTCFSTAVSNIQELCPNSKEAIIWYDACQLRYSNQDFLYDPDVQSNVNRIMVNHFNITADQLLRFETLTTALMGNLSDLAVRNSSRLWATGTTALTTTDTIYGMVQCVRDLSAGSCRTCLQGTVDLIAKEPIKGRKGGRTLGEWCTMRYELNKFYNTTSMLQLHSDSPSLFPTNGSLKATGSSGGARKCWSWRILPVILFLTSS